LVLLLLAGVGAGVINAVAGAGTLLTFPALLAVGVPPVTANGTNTLGLLGGAGSSTWSGRAELRRASRRAALWFSVALAGGAAGALLVVALPAKYFEFIVPWLILISVLVYVVEEPLKRRFGHLPARAATVLIALIGGGYGGYFGAAAGIPVLAIASSVEDDLRSSVALKNLVGLASNGAAGVVFVVFGQVVWTAVAVLLVGSLAGGWLGVLLVGRVPSWIVTTAVVVIGLAAAAVAFNSGW
ncbi:MAG: sulfite exporter TauE/SafE family protein, partial [Actinomycetes bacterium]